MCKLKVFEYKVPRNTLQSQKRELIKLDGDVFRIQHHPLNIINGVKWRITGWSTRIACIRVLKVAQNVLA